MNMTSDPMGIDDTEELDVSDFQAHAVNGIFHEVNAAYCMMRVNEWGFPYELAAEKAQRFVPAVDVVSKQLAQFETPARPTGCIGDELPAGVWESACGKPYKHDGQWRAAYAHGRSVPITEAERVMLDARWLCAQYPEKPTTTFHVEHVETYSTSDVEPEPGPVGYVMSVDRGDEPGQAVVHVSSKQAGTYQLLGIDECGSFNDQQLKDLAAYFEQEDDGEPQ